MPGTPATLILGWGTVVTAHGHLPVPMDGNVPISKGCSGNILYLAFQTGRDMDWAELWGLAQRCRGTGAVMGKKWGARMPSPQSPSLHLHAIGMCPTYQGLLSSKWLLSSHNGC